LQVEVHWFAISHTILPGSAYLLDKDKNVGPQIQISFIRNDCNSYQVAILYFMLAYHCKPKMKARRHKCADGLSLELRFCKESD